MIEFDRTEGEEDLRGRYHPAGPRWLDAVRTDITKRLAEIVIESPNPGDLPLRLATKFELAINLKTAAALGLTIPPNVLAVADEVIE
jgi:hypothetical protein